MEIYISLAIAAGVFSLISALYIKSAELEGYGAILVVRTCNCAAICEGVLRDAVDIMKRPGKGELVVLDKGSIDGTYEILKRISAKYAFSVIQVSSEHEAREIVGLYSSAGDYKLLVMDENTQ